MSDKHRRGFYFIRERPPHGGWEDAPPRERYDGTDWEYEHRWPYCACGLYANKCPELQRREREPASH